MKSAAQLGLGMLAAVGTSLIVLAAASLALVEGGMEVSLAASPSPTLAAEVTRSAPLVGLTVTLPPLPTATEVHPTRCPIPAGWVEYTVQPGDSLEAIAAQLGVPVEQIKKNNCLTSASLYPNSTLFLPPLGSTSTASVEPPTPLPTVAPTSTFTLTPVPCGPPRGWVVYIVQRGDTLFRLSAILGVSMGQLQFANCMAGTELMAGQSLFVPFIPVRTPVPTLTPRPTDTHTPAPPPTVETPPVWVTPKETAPIEPTTAGFGTGGSGTSAPDTTQPSS